MTNLRFLIPVALLCAIGSPAIYQITHNAARTSSVRPASRITQDKRTEQSDRPTTDYLPQTTDYSLSPIPYSLI